jgi:putative flippase GtrA
MLAYTRNKIERLLKLEFIRFCIVGGLGFVINFILLIALAKLFNLSIVLAQLIGAELALGTNFMLHHNWTYKAHRVNKNLKSLLVQFHVTTWPAILGSTAMVSLGVDVFHISKFLALVISSLVSLMWNFIWSKFVIWRDVTPQEIKEIVK